MSGAASGVSGIGGDHRNWDERLHLGGVMKSVRRFTSGYVTSAEVVSDQPYSLLVTGAGSKKSDHDEVRLEDVLGDCWTTIEAALKKELGAGITIDERVIVVLRRSDIPLRSHEEALRGRLSTFIEDLFKDSAINCGPLLRALQVEVFRRSSEEVVATNWDGLLAKQGIRRADMDGWLHYARHHRAAKRCADWWPSALTELIAAGYTFSTRQRLQSVAERLEIQLEPTWNTESALASIDERVAVGINADRSLGQILSDLAANLSFDRLDDRDELIAMALTRIFNGKIRIPEGTSGTSEGS